MCSYLNFAQVTADLSLINSDTAWGWAEKQLAECNSCGQAKTTSAV